VIQPSPTLVAIPRRGLLLTATLAGALTLAGCAAVPVGRSDAGVDPAPLQRFMRQVDADAAAGRLPGAVLLVARHGQLVHASAVGRKDPGQATPMPRDAIFRIYSMTKPIVSIATMMLVEEGKVRLSDPISRIFPEMKGVQVGIEKTGSDGQAVLDRVPAPREMTVQDLLRHTSGLTYGVFGRSAVKSEYLKADLRPGAPGLSYDNADMMRRLGSLPLAYAPGSTWEYSVSTDVLGALVEKVSGKTLDVFLRERIFSPLRMKDTGFAVAPEQQTRLAEAFATDPDTRQAVQLLDVRTAPRLLSGGGGLVSTADDYLRFAQMMLNGGTLDGVRIVSRKTIEYMTSDHLAGVKGPAYLPGPGYGFGLGVAVRTATGESPLIGSVGDYYWGGYAGTYFWVDPKEQLVAVWMMQGPGQSASYRPLLRTAVYNSLR
jgi:CubicO group peptidase (beta-lactamase class C family)